MDPELKQMVQETLLLSRENNKMLKKIRRTQKWANYTRLFYWAVIIGIAVVSWYLTKPYLEKVVNTYNATTSSFENVVGQFGAGKK